MNSNQTPAADALLAEIDALCVAGRHADAIDRLRPAAAAAGAPAKLAVRLCYLLSGAGRDEEAIAAVAERAAAPDADLSVLTAYGVALKAGGRLPQALSAYQRARVVAPASGVAEHNLAAALGDDHQFAQAEAATSRALAKGLDAPETWLVRGRALLGLGRPDDAERAFRQALSRRPNMADAHLELAQLLWMQSEDAQLACRTLDQAMAANPGDASLTRVKVRFLTSLDDRPSAYHVLANALARRDADPLLNADAALVAAWLDGDRAVVHAERAMAALPGNGDAMAALCQAYLAAGRPDSALPLAEAMRRLRPKDQFPIALTGMAWRMLGDARYRELYDYDRFVRHTRIDTPIGWSSLDSYLSDLRASLERLHSMNAHPIGQSLRNGTQTGQSLDRVDDPVVAALFQAVDRSIHAYAAAVQEDGLALSVPYTPGGAYAFDKVWSIRLRPHGFHINHIHPKGWISSACHIVLPNSVDQGHEGWLGFGEPGLPTQPHLPAEHFVRPSPGYLALFPSYMWHGTVPFSGEGERLTVAFDIIPA